MGRTRLSAPASGEVPHTDADGRYQLHGEIARGGMGAIIKGRDIDLGRDLAVKVLLEEYREKGEVIQRFVEEAQIGGQLQHPGIVPVYELGQFQDQRPFFTMKLVKGQTLSALLAERSSSDEDRAKFLGIFEQVCQTMAYAHSRAVIHRDLKPSNVMVGAFGEVQVMDWGLAKVLSEGGVADERKDHETRTGVSIIQTIRSLGSDMPQRLGSVRDGSQTQMGSVLGTPAYMSPEQALGEIDRLDERTDVFALGGILCQILTGHPPYTGDEHIEVYRKASRGNLDDCFLRLDHCGADEELRDLAKECLEVEPDSRIRNAGVLAQRLANYLESVEQRLRHSEFARIAAETRSEEERKRRKVVMALAATVLLTVGTGMAGWLWVKEKDAVIDRAAANARSELEQQVAGELSTATALGRLEAQGLPNASDVDRALSAVERAEQLLAKGEVGQGYTKAVADARVDLESINADFQLISDLESAWDEEREYHAAQKRWRRRAAQRDSGGDRSSSSTSDEAPELLTIENPSHAFRGAFTRWGLPLDHRSVEQAVAQLETLDHSLLPTVLVSLDRWRALVASPRTIEQWQEVSWTTLDPIELKSQGRDRLTLLDDQSILASGPTPWAGYDLVFETDLTELAALRLEAMLHDSLQNRGPGRQEGVFAIRNLQIRYAPKDDLRNSHPLSLDQAVADYSSIDLPITTDQWDITNGGGSPHVAVFVLPNAVKSESGFRLWITNDNNYRGDREAESLGRFRWSITSSSASSQPALATVLERIVWAADKDPWRIAARHEVARRDLDALVKRVRNSSAVVTQPTTVLSRLAEHLSSFDGAELAEHMQQVDWHHFHPDTVTSSTGVTLTLREDDVVEASGANPPTDEMSLSAALSGQRPTGLRLELIPAKPDLHGGETLRIGRNDTAYIRDIRITLASSDDPGKQIEVTPDAAFIDYPEEFSLAAMFDNDLASYCHLVRCSSRQRIYIDLPDVATMPNSEWTLHIATGPSSKNLHRFRLAYTTHEFAIPYVSRSARELMEALSDRAPADYWARLALAETLLRQVPPQNDEALRHATAAVALRPDAVGGHAAVLRALPVHRFLNDGALQRTAIAHVGQLRQIDAIHPAIDELVAALITTGTELWEAGDPAAATRIYQFSMTLRSPNVGSYRNLATTLLERGTTPLALESAMLAVELAPNDPVSLHQVGEVYRKLGNMDAALDYFHRSTTTDPSFTVGYRSQAVCYQAVNRHAESVEVLLKAVSANRLEATNYESLGDAYITDKRPAEAIEAYRKAVELQPHHLGYRTRLAEQLGNEDRFDEVIEIWQDLLDIDPENATALNNLGVVYYWHGHLDEAIGVAERFVALEPDEPTLCGNLAHLYRLVGRTDDGKNVFRQALELDDGNVELYSNFGFFLESIEESRNAMEMWREAIRVDPNIATSYDRLGKLLEEQGNTDDAIGIYRKQIERIPTYVDGYRQLAKVMDREGRFDEVIPLFQQALTSQPDNVNLHDGIAWELAKRSACTDAEGKWAVELSTMAVEIQPESFTFVRNLGVANYRAGNWRQAIDCHEQAVEQLIEHYPWDQNSTTELSIHIAYARVYQAMAAYQLGETETAFDYLHEAEGAFGNLAFVEVIDADVSDWYGVVASTLQEARHTLGRPTHFTAEERIDRSLTSWADYVNAYPADAEQTMWLATMLAWYGRTEERMKLCRTAFGHLTPPKSRMEAENQCRIARGYLIVPTNDHDLTAKAVAAARSSMTHGFRHASARMALKRTLGMAELRAGNYSKAEELLNEVLRFAPIGDIYYGLGNRALLLRCIARHYLGKHAEARSDFDTIKKRILPLPTRDVLPSERFPNNIAEALLYEEAKALLESTAE